MGHPGQMAKKDNKKATWTCINNELLQTYVPGSTQQMDYAEHML